MKNTSILSLLRPLVLVGCFSLLSVGVVVAGQGGESNSCKVECSKKSSAYQQRCSAFFYNPESRVFHDTDALVRCVQFLRNRVDLCEKRCSRLKNY